MRVFNFSPSPSVLPAVVLEQIREDIRDYCGSGMSVMELSPSSSLAREIIEEAEHLVRELLNVPMNYRVIFCEGPVAMHYSAIPLNFLSEHKCADYIVSGHYSNIAYREAKRYGDIAMVRSTAGAEFLALPKVSSETFRPDADYAYLCMNDAVWGTKYSEIPSGITIPLVADMSSFLFSEPVDVSKFAMIFASCEQNLGISGMTLLIIREDMLRRDKEELPTKLSYRKLAMADEMLTTPPIFAIHTAKRILEWLKSLGGLEEVKRQNEKKASLLYDYLDDQPFYNTPVEVRSRSLMNIFFTTGDGALDSKFAEEAARAGLLNLAGLCAKGGLCASVYNAMPYEGVEALVAFMKRFRMANPKWNMGEEPEIEEVAYSALDL